MPPVDAVPSDTVYQPRCVDKELAYQIVAAELDGFLAAAEERGHSLPSFVETTLRDFLTCGVPEPGFLRVRRPMDGDGSCSDVLCNPGNRPQAFLPFARKRAIAATGIKALQETWPAGSARAARRNCIARLDA